MNKTKLENGITLIALIITIIILLILAVVTIGSIKDIDIIGYAQNVSEKWKELWLESSGTPIYVNYDKDYSSNTIDLGGRTGYSLKIHKKGGLYNSFSSDAGNEVKVNEIEYFKNNNYAYVDTNFISYLVTFSGYNYVGIHFKADGTADIYWEEPKNIDNTGPITSIEGLTPVGTISVAQ